MCYNTFVGTGAGHEFEHVGVFTGRDGRDFEDSANRYFNTIVFSAVQQQWRKNGYEKNKKLAATPFDVGFLILLRDFFLKSY